MRSTSIDNTYQSSIGFDEIIKTPPTKSNWTLVPGRSKMDCIMWNSMEYCLKSLPSSSRDPDFDSQIWDKSVLSYVTENHFVCNAVWSARQCMRYFDAMVRYITVFDLHCTYVRINMTLSQMKVKRTQTKQRFNHVIPRSVKTTGILDNCVLLLLWANQRPPSGIGNGN